MELWNNKDLQPPSISTYKAINNVDSSNLRSLFKEAVDFFNRQQHLNGEYIILARCIYRMKLKFRHDKGVKEISKSNKALFQYLQLDMQSIVEKFYALIPVRYSGEMYLPTRNMLDYILVRIQGISKLLCRVIDTSRIAAQFMDNRIETGQFWKVAFIIFGSISRISLLAKCVTQYCCHFYSQILPFRTMLENTSQQWLPENYIFPKSLPEWLEVDWINASEDLVGFEQPEPIKSEAEFDSISDKNTEDNEKVLLSIDKIRSLEELKSFVQKENELKRRQSKHSIFKDLDMLQWNMLHNVIKKYIKRAEKGDSHRSNIFVYKAISTMEMSLKRI